MAFCHEGELIKKKKDTDKRRRRRRGRRELGVGRGVGGWKASGCF